MGKLLVHDTPLGRMSGWIVETEAYLGPLDKAAHSYQARRTKKTEVMYHGKGTIYLYQLHTHTMMNIITQEKGIPEGVLIRAIEPFEGIDMMKSHRHAAGFELTNGPGKLTRALNISLAEKGKSIFHSVVSLDEDYVRTPRQVVRTPRIGIPNKGIWTDAPLRFIVQGNPYVSRRKGKIDANFGWV